MQCKTIYVVKLNTDHSEKPSSARPIMCEKTSSSSESDQKWLSNWQMCQSSPWTHIDDPQPSDLYPRTLQIKSGTKVPYLFSDGEMSRRVSGLRSYMTNNNIEAVILTSIHNIIYFGGFFVYTMGRNYALFVTAEKWKLLVNGVDGGRPWRRAAVEVATYTDWQEDNFFHFLRQELGDIQTNLGLEFDYVSFTNAAKFDKAFPNASKVDIGYETMRLKMIKSDEEVALLRNSNRIADIGGAAVVDAIKNEASEYEASQAAVRAMDTEISKTYPDVEIRDTWCWVASGPSNPDCGHPPNTSRKPQPGDNIIFNCFPIIGGYYAALERTAFYEYATEEQIKMWTSNCEVYRRGMELIQPGIKCCDIAKEMTNVYHKYDLAKYRMFGYGHSTGIVNHYFGREKGDLELRENCAAELQPGMLITVEPHILVPEGCPGAGTYRDHDTLIVTKDGAENITKFPTGPEHLIIKKDK